MKLKLIAVNLLGILMITLIILAQAFSRIFAMTTLEFYSVGIMIFAILLSTINLNFVLLEKKFKDKGRYNAISNIAISIYLFFTVISALNVLNWYSSMIIFIIVNAVAFIILAGIIIYAFMVGNGKECKFCLFFEKLGKEKN